MTRALFIGRFQPIHEGHLSAIKEILSQYDEVAIIVGSSQENLTGRNPLTTGERIEMIYAVLRANGFASRAYVIPVPDTPESGLWPARVLSYAPKVDAVFTANDYTQNLFSIYNGSVRDGIRIINQKVVGKISATAIRDKIIKGDASWERMVPKDAVAFLKKNKLDARIKILADSSIG
ncbi:MAG: nicotinamide-nucleotide adenylyltransferase [Candidatus Micrarchaeia archaeon]|jgi:nicotinamide-nucleotide adenylyltransferase